MSQVQYSPEFIQRRKMAMVLPVFIGFASCFLFWIFDGGTQKSKNKGGLPFISLNTNLFSDKEVETSLNSSLDQKEVTQNKELKLPTIATPDFSKDKKPELNQPLNEISKPLNQETNSLPDTSLEEESRVSEEGEITKKDKFDEELKAFYEKYEKNESIPSSEINQENLDDKTIEVQDPETEIPAKVKPYFNKGINSLVDHLPNQSVYNERFYQIGHSKAYSSDMIKVAVHQNQKLSNGSRIKLRLLSDIDINGKIIPKNTILSGSISIGTSRVNIQLNSIFYKDNILPFQVEVYDRDGLSGLDVPGVLVQGSREIAAQMVDSIRMQELQFQNVVNNANQSGFGFQLFRPDIGEQILYDGIRSALEATKTFIRSKLLNNEVYIKANHILYLRENNQIKKNEKK